MLRLGAEIRSRRVFDAGPLPAHLQSLLERLQSFHASPGSGGAPYNAASEDDHGGLLHGDPERDRTQR
jgi:hypothetical protein